MKPASTTILVLSLLLGACSDERAAGGTGETENAVSARYFLLDSLLGHGAMAPTVATLKLDSTNFDFSHSDPSGRDLDVRTSAGTSLPFALAHWDPSAFRGRLRVRIEKDMVAAGARIAVLSGLPRADRSNSVGLWEGIAESLRIELTSVLVDDFERGSLKTPLPDSSAWFVLAGTGNGIALAGGGRPGNALRAVSGSASTNPVAVAAALLASTPRSLRSVDSIVFWARGQGAARVGLEYAMAGTQKVARSTLALDTSWHRIRVLPAAFDSTASDGAWWSQVRDSVSHLSFWMVGPGELWIDDPRIYGIDRDDLR